MKKRIILVTLLSFFVLSFSLSAKEIDDDTELNDISDEDEEEQELQKVRKKALKKRQRILEQRLIKERKEAAEQKAQLDSYREAHSNATEYTVNPESVKLAVELNPDNYGFFGKNHTMAFSLQFDYILKGRSLLNYDVRITDTLSLSLKGGIDFTAMSLISKIRQQMSKPAPSQFSTLVGLGAQWRLTEWYLNSSFSLEPSFIMGRMWQIFANQKTTHWRLLPGMFFGVTTLFDSGFMLSAKAGAEFPFDFGSANAVKELVHPSMMVGFGFAL